MLVLVPPRRAAPQAATYAKGIDVSHWQGRDRLAAGRRRVVHASPSAKATEGNDAHRPDVLDQPRRRGDGRPARSAPITSRGLAAPATPALIANAIAQADLFLDVAQPQAGRAAARARPRDEGRPVARRRSQTWTSAWLDEVAARTGVQRARLRVAELLEDRARRHDRRRRRPAIRSGSRTGRRTPRRSSRAANWGGLGWTFWQYTSDCARARLSRMRRRRPLQRRRSVRGRDPARIPAARRRRALPPTIVGTAQTGKTLAGVPGTLERRQAGRRSRYQWQRCDAAGAGCLPIVGRDFGDLRPGRPPTSAMRSASPSPRRAPAGRDRRRRRATVAVVGAGATVTRPAATRAPDGDRHAAGRARR